jgi:hypothetical protein
MSAYGTGGGEREGWLRDAFARAGKKLDMGKSCIRFKTLDDLPLPAIGEFIASVPANEFIALYERSREGTKSGQRAAARAAEGTGARKSAKKAAKSRETS